MGSETVVRAKAIFGEECYPLIEERVLKITRTSPRTTEQIMNDFSKIALIRGIDFALSEELYRKSLQSDYILSYLVLLGCR